MLRSATIISRRMFRLLNNQANRELEASIMYSAFSEWFRHNKLFGSTEWCQHHATEEREHAQILFHHLSKRRVVSASDEEEDEATGQKGAQAEASLSSEKEGEGQGVFRSLLPPRLYRGIAGIGGLLHKDEEQRDIPLESDRPVESLPFEWDRVANVKLEVKDHFDADFDDPIHLWKTALEQEQANSRAYFHIMRLAKDENDYVTEQLIQSYYIPEQLEEEQAVEEILQNTMLVMAKGPDKYFELDRDMPSKPH